jgi:CheY-like chemotaxis protein
MIIKKILFVDDDPGMLVVGKMLLKSLGHEVSLVSSGEEAIEFLKNSKSDIDFIFLDLMMPGINGFEVLTFMRDSHIHIPTVVQTGLIDDDDLNKVKELGVVDCIIKPYSKGDLKLAIEKMIQFTENSKHSTK